MIVEQMFNYCFVCEYDLWNLFAPNFFDLVAKVFLNRIVLTFVQVLEPVGRVDNKNIDFATTLIWCDESTSHSSCGISSGSLSLGLLALCVNKVRIELSSSTTTASKTILLLLS